MLAIDFHYVTLCGIPIPYSDNAVHLGCFVGNGSNQLNVKKATQDLYAQVNMLLCNFSQCSPDIKCYLFRVFCTSFYGCPLWDLREPHLNSFQICLRKCVRRLLNLNPRTHNALIPHLIDLPEPRTLLLCRFSSFLAKCLHSPNSLVQLASSLVTSNLTQSVVYSNATCLLNDLNFQSSSVLGNAPLLHNMLRERYKASCDENDISIAILVKDLCHLKYFNDSNLHLNEILFALNELCVN